jgi:hypothetical protein
MHKYCNQNSAGLKQKGLGNSGNELAQHWFGWKVHQFILYVKPVKESVRKVYSLPTHRSLTNYTGQSTHCKKGSLTLQAVHELELPL